jgi:hypothetical protein
MMTSNGPPTPSLWPGHIPSLTEALTPAVQAVENQPGDLLTNAIKQNVVLTVQKLQAGRANFQRGSEPKETQDRRRRLRS